MIAPSKGAQPRANLQHVCRGSVREKGRVGHVIIPPSHCDFPSDCFPQKICVVGPYAVTLGAVCWCFSVCWLVKGLVISTPPARRLFGRCSVKLGEDSSKPDLPIVLLTMPARWMPLRVPGTASGC